MSFFAFPTVNSWEENVFKLTPAGIVTVVVLMTVLMTTSILLRPKNKSVSSVMAARQLIFSAVAMSLALVTAEIKFTRLPMGGSITLFSMLFVVLI